MIIDNAKLFILDSFNQDEKFINSLDSSNVDVTTIIPMLVNSRSSELIAYVDWYIASLEFSAMWLEDSLTTNQRTIAYWVTQELKKRLS